VQGRFFTQLLSTFILSPLADVFLTLQDIAGQVRNNYYATNAGAGKSKTLINIVTFPSDFVIN
jgi:hypothetical protein